MITITSPLQWLTLITLPPLGIAAATVIIGYVILEVGFFYHYHWHLVPRANQLSPGPPVPYRDYVDIKDREKLLARIIDRLIERIPENDSNSNNLTDNNDAAQSAAYKFVESWFQKKNDDGPYEKFSEEFDLATLDVGLCPPPPAIIRMAWSSLGGRSNDASVDDDSKSNKSSSDSLLMLDGESSGSVTNNFMQNNECTNNANNNPTECDTSKPTRDRLQKGNMDEFLSWAFFDVPFSTAQSNPAMQRAMESFYTILQTQTGLSFEPGSNPNYIPRAFTFEKVKSLYRPFGVYASVAMMRMAANCILWILGFRQYTCKRGLRYWHRSAKHQKGSPFIFFHGIAPGGHAPYLPMLFLGILRGQLCHRNRDVFLFENKPISYALCFDALSEEDTVHGVLEAIHLHLGTTPAANNLTLCGHSFGSCQLTWMVSSPELKHRIRSMILVDPVTILLSEPDVVVNFLYARQDIQDECIGNFSSWTGRLIRFFNETKIHLVASSEMFIEHYLRRNFAWYNSELWLQDIPPHVKVVVCLAEHDEIVNTPKIKRVLDSHNSKVSREVCSSAFIEKIIWRDVGHAHCVTNPERWSDVHKAIMKVESQILEEERAQKSR